MSVVTRQLTHSGSRRPPQFEGVVLRFVLRQLRSAAGGTVVEVVLEVVDDVLVDVGSGGRVTLVDVGSGGRVTLVDVGSGGRVRLVDVDVGPPPPLDVEVVTCDNWQFVGGGRSETQLAWLASSSSARVSSTRRTTISASAIPVSARAYSGIAAPRRPRDLPAC
jgi:hypothetical protein